MRPLAFATALIAATPFVLTGCGHLSPGRAAQVSTGYVAHQLCSAVFIAGRDPEPYYHDAILPLGGSVAFLMKHSIDREHGEVRATFAGMAESRAIYRPPFGCVNATPTNLTGSKTPAVEHIVASAPLLAPIAGPDVVQTSNPAITGALDRMFQEPEQGPHRNTQAVVVIHQDRIIAERYAPGVGVNTPLVGWSATKSVTNAMLGILVLQGKLDMNAPAPIAAWADPQDPRHAITPDQLLRMSSGLDMGQTLHDVSPFDPAAQMLFIENDMAAIAERAPLAHAPGTHWNYTDPNTILLSRMVRNMVGGDMASSYQFMNRELFDKLGMQHATLEFDGAGTPVGASQMWATARDWAKFGLLYLHDGVIGGERILPTGWVEYSARLTPGSEFVGYGAGFWTNRGTGFGAEYRTKAGIPADAFMARGSYGQYVVIIPSEQLIIARFGPAWTPRDDMDMVASLTKEVIAQLKAAKVVSNQLSS